MVSTSGNSGIREPQLIELVNSEDGRGHSNGGSECLAALVPSDDEITLSATIRSTWRLAIKSDYTADAHSAEDRHRTVTGAARTKQSSL
jgi:hypothetical protein